MKPERIPSAYWFKANSFVTSIHIQYKAKDDKPVEENGWVITCRGNVVWDKIKKDWVDEPSPSSRSESHLQNTRFSLDEAFDLAQEALKKEPFS